MCEHFEIIEASKTALLDVRQEFILMWHDKTFPKGVGLIVFKEVTKHIKAYDASLKFFNITEQSCGPCQWARLDETTHIVTFTAKLNVFVTDFISK